MAKQKLITKCKCRNTGYNDSSRYLRFHLCFLLVLSSQSSNSTRELLRQGASRAGPGLQPSRRAACDCRAQHAARSRDATELLDGTGGEPARQSCCRSLLESGRLK